MNAGKVRAGPDAPLGSAKTKAALVYRALRARKGEWIDAPGCLCTTRITSPGA
jgi:hypothetical protein